MRRLLLILILASFLGARGVSAGETEAEKIAYVDLFQVFDEYQKTKDLEKDLEKKGKEKEAEIEVKAEEIRKLKEETNLLGEAARAEKEKIINERITSLRQLDLEIRTSLRQERDNLRRDILKEILGVVEKYGKDNGYRYLLDKRLILYGEEKEDLTPEILKILNNDYKGKKK